MCDYYSRGIFTADEACGGILRFCVEPPLAVEYLGLLPDDLRAALAKFLPTLPVSDEGWAGFQGGGQLDGDEWSWAQSIAEYRANTEAVRTCVFGESSPPTSAQFIDCVRAAYRARMDEIRRSLGEI